MPDSEVQPLAKFVLALKTIASQKIEQLNQHSGLDLTIVQGLYEEGCITAMDASSKDGKAFLEPRITPKGAVALSQWSEILHRNSAKGRIASALERMAWVAVGLLSSIVVQLVTG